MYSTVGLLKNSKHSGRLVGTHQKLDRAARAWLTKLSPDFADFPTAKEIIYFEGTRGPDGLKRKSPGVDEPIHFILPDNDDGRLIKDILDHQHNLHLALLKQDQTRTAFEAAWLAHAITDGLTPAHHFPYQEAVSELMSDKEYVTIFGQPVKGIMRGETFAQAARNNWLYWGVEGVMSKHIVFEYGAAIVAKSTPNRKLVPHLSQAELAHIKRYDELDLKSEFYASLRRIHNLKMYDRFRARGWNRELALETRQILLPEIVKMITIGWLSSMPSRAEIANYAAKNGKPAKKRTKKAKK
ncbi:hypothetical protein IJG78_02295 [Candidatus Saccharibacteria bacterium]|nr:hypothetical protein [Candidatus Saccharibacteria bacterium]